MNKCNQSIRLENLPDEIFLYRIVPLFSCQELYLTFFGLNQRLNNIIRSTKHLKFTVNAGNNHDSALAFFVPCITRLTVCLGQFDITAFVSLRSLTLQYPSLNQRNAIRPENFPCLEYLNLSYPLEDLTLSNLIFSNAFKYLKQCEFGRTLTDHSWNGSPKLRSLSVSVEDSYGIFCILHACPNISQLNIIVYEAYQGSLSLPRYSIPCMNLHVRHLFIRSRFQILVPVLTLTPNLKWLTFDDMIKNDYHNENSAFNFKVLAKILSNLKQLSYLHFTIATSIWDGRTPVHNLHPLFEHVNSAGTSSVVIVSSSAI